MNNLCASTNNRPRMHCVFRSCVRLSVHPSIRSSDPLTPISCATISLLGHRSKVKVMTTPAVMAEACISTAGVDAHLFHTSFESTGVHRRISGWNSGGRMANAEGGLVPSGVRCGEGCPLSSRLGGLGRIMSSPAGSGAEPRPKTDFGVFWRPQNAPFCTYTTKSEGDNLY